MEQEKDPGKGSLRSKLWSWTGFGERKLWDWLHLLSALALPIMLAVAGFWFEAQVDDRQRDIEEQRAQDAALQAYFDQMSQLMLEKNLRDSEEGSEARTLARARTLTILSRLSSDRKKRLLQFLYEAYLIKEANPVVDLDGAALRGLDLSGNNLSGGPFLIKTQLGSGRSSIVGQPDNAASLSGANLSDANLERSLLIGTNLSGTDLSDATLSVADLSYANLSGAVLKGADLSHIALEEANLSGADLSHTNLSSANLKGAKLSFAADPRFGGSALEVAGTSTDLSHAVLEEADLRGADLSGASLSSADLSNANLTGADLDNANLSGADLSGTKGVPKLPTRR